MSVFIPTFFVCTLFGPGHPHSHLQKLTIANRIQRMIHLYWYVLIRLHMLKLSVGKGRQIITTALQWSVRVAILCYSGYRRCGVCALERSSSNRSHTLNSSYTWSSVEGRNSSHMHVQTQLSGYGHNRGSKRAFLRGSSTAVNSLGLVLLQRGCFFVDDI